MYLAYPTVVTEVYAKRFWKNPPEVPTPDLRSSCVICSPPTSAGWEWQGLPSSRPELTWGGRACSRVRAGGCRARTRWVQLEARLFDSVAPSRANSTSWLEFWSLPFFPSSGFHLAQSRGLAKSGEHGGSGFDCSGPGKSCYPPPNRLNKETLGKGLFRKVNGNHKHGEAPGVGREGTTATVGWRDREGRRS